MIKIKRNYYEIEEWARRSEMVDEAVHYMEQLKFFLEVEGVPACECYIGRLARMGGTDLVLYVLKERREEMGIYES